MPEEDAEQNTGHHSPTQNDKRETQGTSKHLRCSRTGDRDEVKTEHVERLHQSRWTYTASMWNPYIGNGSEETKAQMVGHVQ